ncbi:MAG: hypothetical protein ACYC36_03685 [Bellilinea sp.]
MTWIEVNISYKEFDERGLSAPGTLIDTEHGEFLIGDINPNRGVCDDCVEFGEHTIVKRYKIVWSK